MNDRTDHASPPPDSADPHHSIAHVMPLRVLLGVFAALAVLTVVTVYAATIDLGEANLLIAMGIATVKAALVALYFMHLRYDNPFNGLIFVIGLAFLTLFLVVTLIDTLQYQPDIRNW